MGRYFLLTKSGVVKINEQRKVYIDEIWKRLDQLRDYYAVEKKGYHQSKSWLVLVPLDKHELGRIL